MALDLRLQQKMSQQLVMTPQLQQAIRLLQLNRLELIDAIHAELERRGRGGAGESLRGPVAMGMTLGFAAAAALLLWPVREPALTFAVGEPTQAGEEGACPVFHAHLHMFRI